ncbi:hypothetical protein [Thermomonospora umbrina]|uniref:hypothetical protein n=1 Tax=Thermomonospora umbrina TaxID=111806 RepID=UPI0011C1013C|nr:hypothetical protein [Thermomonospora umbrina]
MERRARLLTDTARALVQTGRPDQAIDALLAAHVHAPTEVRDRRSIRTLAIGPTRRRPRSTSAVRLMLALGTRPEI